MERDTLAVLGGIGAIVATCILTLGLIVFAMSDESRATVSQSIDFSNPAILIIGLVFLALVVAGFYGIKK